MVHGRGYIPYANSNNGRTVHPFAFFISSRLRQRPPARDRLMTSCCCAARHGATRRAQRIQNSIAFFLPTPDCRTLLAPYGQSRNFEHARNCSRQAMTMTAVAATYVCAMNTPLGYARKSMQSASSVLLQVE